jgi:hypothetical protein
MTYGFIFASRVAINPEAIQFIDFRHDSVVTGAEGNIAIHMGASSITVPSDSDDAKVLREAFLPATEPIDDPPAAAPAPAASAPAASGPQLVKTEPQAS